MTDGTGAAGKAVPVFFSAGNKKCSSKKYPFPLWKLPILYIIVSLSFIIKDEYKNSIDNLYNEMMSKDYSRILELSEFTNVEDVLGLFLTRKELDIKIVCKNLEEKQIFKNRNKKYNIVVFENYKDIDVEPYDAIYTKYYKDYSKFNKIVAKTLYFANAKYNFTNKNIIDPEIYINLDGPNEFKAINLY